MIAFLEGVVASKGESSVLLNVGGVGFEIGVSLDTCTKLPEIGSQIMIHTYMQVREDGMQLYGFLSLEEKALFEKLITVSGVGPKVALAALSFYGPEELSSHIFAQDITAIQRVPGIGKKMASRIILELKGSLEESLPNLLDNKVQQNPALQSVNEALLAMGFTSAEADLALAGAPQDASEGALLQYALKKLGS